MKASLVVKGVSAGYGKIRILEDVSLRIEAGETVAVLGPNGSGKSTLAKTIMDLATLHGGSITWNGEEISHMPGWRRVRKGIGYVPQGQNVFPSLTVRENLALARSSASRMGKRKELDKLRDLFPELAKLEPTLAAKLSGGERRILALATTLLLAPEMLLLDEPTSDLAPLMIERIFGVIEQVRVKTGFPILLVEQNVARALSIADRVCILRRGSIILDRLVSDVTEADIVAAFMEHSELPEIGDEIRRNA